MDNSNEQDSTVSSGSGKCCACDCIPRSAMDLVMWRDIKKTAPVFVGGLVFLFMLDNLSLISVVAYTGLLLLLCAVVTKALSKFAPKMVESCPFTCFVVPQEESCKCEITREQAERYVDKTLPHVNAAISHGREVFLLTNPVETAKHALLFWLLTYLGACFNLMTLVIIAFIVAFTAPRVYEQFQPQFDNLGALIKANLGQAYKVATDKVNEAMQKVRERSGKKTN